MAVRTVADGPVMVPLEDRPSGARGAMILSIEHSGGGRGDVNRSAVPLCRTAELYLAPVYADSA